jgi:hypothetical protein
MDGVMETPEQVRDELDRLLRPTLSEDEWHICVEQRWVDDILEDPREMQDLVQRIRAFRRAYRSNQRRPTVREPKPAAGDLERFVSQTRIYLVTMLFLRDANRLERVTTFRAEYVGPELLDNLEMEYWLWDRSRENLPETIGLGAIDHLEYLDPAGNVDYVPYKRRDGGPLEILSFLGQHLVDRYGWKVWEATNFVLCGTVPELDEFEVEIVGREPFAAGTRLVMTVDLALSPSEVAKRYEHHRQRVLGKRYRSIDRKHIALVFLYVTSREASWADRMERWNQLADEGWMFTQAGDDWRYSNVRNFCRDVRGAIKRLLREGEQFIEEEPEDVDAVL